MASVVFSTVGQAIGGPLGAAVGAVVGGTLDGALSGRRSSMPVADIFFQKSAYGEPLPRLFGTCRVAGQLVWALPFATPGGKGSRRSGSMASFAILLSSGPIMGIGRIWADGREIRGADGQFEMPTTMRLHDGRGSGVADPLIVAAEGVGRAPAYPGCAYVVFEDFGLQPFGNRLPNLGFEVFADSGSPQDWIRALAGEVVRGPDGARMAQGYVATRPRIAGDVQALARLSGTGAGYRHGAFVLDGAPPLHSIAASDLAEADEDAVGGGNGGWMVARRGLAANARPAGCSLTYLDPDRDYQAGRQLVARGRTGEELSVSALVVARADQARALAGHWLREAEAAVETLEIALGWRWLGLSAGDHVELEGRPGRWRVVRLDVRGLRLIVVAEMLSEALPLVQRPADPGRVLPAPVIPASVTRIVAFETPVPLREGPPALRILATGGAGWRGAELSIAGQGEDIALGTVSRAFPQGELVAPLGVGPDNLWDERNSLLVRPQAGQEMFESRSAAAILEGANLVRVGEELLQFRDAWPEEGGIVRLSGLLRGCFGTAQPVAGHMAGSAVHLVRPDSLPAYGIGADSIGRILSVLAIGPGDPAGGTLAQVVVSGAGVGPMAPVHVRVERQPDGAILSSWIMRGREAWSWNNAEPAAANLIWRFRSDSGPVFEWQVSGTMLELSPDAQMERAGGLLPSGTVEIVAIGDGPAWMRTSRRHAI